MRADRDIGEGAPPAALCGGRFLVEKVLGRGAMGQVLAAHDRERRCAVAVKRLRRRHADAIYRLKHEFRAAAELVHPNLVALHELVQDGDDWYLILERVDGVDLRTWVRGELDGAAAPPAATATFDGSFADEPTTQVGVARRGEGTAPSLDRLRDAFRQLVTAVATLHTAGYLHRDLKPSNLLVTSDGRVVVLDFGIATEIDSDGGATDIAGTPEYMAPEQARGAPSTASDWYSVGTILFECLTGQRPIGGAPDLVMRRKQTTESRRPRAVVAEIPIELDELCARLLRIAPHERPSTAEVLAFFGATAPTPADAADVVGRGAELGALRDGVAALRHGRGSVWYLHGVSGIGKSALLERFTSDATRHPGLVLMTARCFQREHLAYKAVDGIVDALAAALRSDPQWTAAVELPTHADLAARLFPVLRRVPRLARLEDAPEIDPVEMRRRAFTALRELVHAYAAVHPLVIVIDDAQWGDADSVPLLAELMRAPMPRVMLVVSYRSDEADSPLVAGLARELAATTPTDLPVRELGIADSRRLAAAIVGASIEQTVVKDVARESGGNPFFVHELARHARRRGAASLRPGQISLDHAIAARVAALTPAARTLLATVAIAARPLPLTVAIAAAVDADVATARALIRDRLLREATSDGAEAIETFHDRIREVVTGELAAAEQRRHHLSVAEALLAHGAPEPSRLARHLLAAHDPRGIAVAVEAIDAAERALAFDHAASVCAAVLEQAALTGDQRRRMLLRLGRALSRAGRGPDAADAFLAALDGAPPLEALELQRDAGSLYLRSGHVDRGLDLLESLMRGSGLRLAKTPRGALVNLLARRARLRLTGLRPRATARPATPERMALVDLCRSTSIGLAMIDNVRGAEAHSLHALIALGAGDRERAAHALYGEVAFAALTGPRGRARARQVLARADAHAGDGGTELRGWSAGMECLIEYQAGHWRRSLELAERANQLWRECDGLWFEVMTAELYRLWCLYYLGDAAELAAHVERLEREFGQRGDLYALANIRSGLPSAAWVLRGDPRAARVQIERAIAGWTTRGYHLQHYWALFAQAQLDLATGDGAAAHARVEAGWPALERSLLLRIQLVHLEALHLRARAALAAAAHRDDAALVRRAARWARPLRSCGEPWAEALGACFDAGVVARACDPRAAAHAFTAAAAACDRADLHLYAAAARWRAAHLIDGDRGPADAALAALGIADPAATCAMLVPA